MVRVIVAGGRNFIPSENDERWLITMLKALEATHVISGCAKGADTFGETIAKKLKLPIMQYPADWNKFGKSAGYKRNIQMADNADALIVFEGGKGTAMMIDIARKKGLKTIQHFTFKE